MRPSGKAEEGHTPQLQKQGGECGSTPGEKEEGGKTRNGGHSRPGRGQAKGEEEWHLVKKIVEVEDAGLITPKEDRENQKRTFPLGGTPPENKVTEGKKGLVRWHSSGRCEYPNGFQKLRHLVVEGHPSFP